jgi:sulfur carrier protein
VLQLIINGDAVQVPASVTTVSALLGHFELGKKIVVVEINGRILEKSAHAETPIADGDRIEMVHFVGGG